MTQPQDTPKRPGKFASIFPTVVIAASLLGAAAWVLDRRSAAEEAHMIPAPAVDTPGGNAASAVAILAGGCCWGVQAVFQHVKCVTNAVSAYAGGDQESAHHNIVSAGGTGHAESVEVTFDPRHVG